MTAGLIILGCAMALCVFGFIFSLVSCKRKDKEWCELKQKYDITVNVYEQKTSQFIDNYNKLLKEFKEYKAANALSGSLSYGEKKESDVIDNGEKYSKLASEKENECEKLDKIATNLKTNLESGIITTHKMNTINDDPNVEFGRIELNSGEQFEIDEIRPILKKLKNPAPLAKAIWELYYRDKIKKMKQDMGVDTRKSGIYRIWSSNFAAIQGNEVPEGEDKRSIPCYIGKSVDIGERGSQHAKRLVGAEPITGIKFYSSDLKLEDLCWEVLEYVPENQLNEKEAMWIKYYDSIRNGGNSKS